MQVDWREDGTLGRLGLMVSSAIGGVVGIGSAAAGAITANNAANSQEKAAEDAIKAQKDMFATVQGNLAPYISAGGPAMGSLQLLTGTNPGGNPLISPLTQPFTPTIDSLKQTPGYQFTLDQGLKATQNSYAAQGLGTSGAAMKGAAQFATGLADNTYQQQFQDYLSGQGQIYNMLQGIVGTGASAAAGLAPQATATGANIGNALIGGGNAAAAGSIGIGNAITGGFSSGLNAYLQGQFLNNLTSSGGGGGGGGSGGVG